MLLSSRPDGLPAARPVAGSNATSASAATPAAPNVDRLIRLLARTALATPRLAAPQVGPPPRAPLTGRKTNR